MGTSCRCGDALNIFCSTVTTHGTLSLSKSSFDLSYQPGVMRKVCAGSVHACGML